ncbi:PO113 protein, partial [Hydrobates tethys]|nr:PO113 protein [Oceanodroma tethys]
IVEGNARADRLAAAVWAGPAPNILGQAMQSHRFFHQSAKVMAKQFHISMGDAKGVIQSCPDCQRLGPAVPLAANPRGLHSLQLWQMDVTHIPAFGNLKYIHVAVDCYSAAIWATAQ